MKSVFPIKYIVMLLGVFITIWPALYNHYALFFTDSQLYINCGNEFSYTEDRSFVYGWFIGITPDLVTGVWVGAEDRSVRFKSMNYGQGARMALPIYGFYMKQVYKDTHIGLSTLDFSEPSDYDIRRYACSDASIPEEVIDEGDVPFDNDF